MNFSVAELDAHEQPSDELRAEWKSFSKMDDKLFDQSKIDDPYSSAKASDFQVAGYVSVETLKSAFGKLCSHATSELQVDEDKPIYYHPLMPGQSTPLVSCLCLLFGVNVCQGLLILPSLLPPEIQRTMLRHMVHRDLTDPAHTTNMHLHFNLPYPAPDEDGESSFFSYLPDSATKFEPKDPSVHKSLSMKQVLERKLHWVTLGGQYDWTNRVYPDGRPPAFPPDLAGFVETLFPETRAQAAIVNFYTPGDHMMMHRDVSEETDRGLASFSLGCEGLFMITPFDAGKMSPKERAAFGGKEYLLLRQRSGDAVYMTQEARFAWHGVPKVLRGTCPEYLEDWPAEGGKYEAWRGWMRNKRINLNVRQVHE